MREQLPSVIQGWIYQLETDKELHKFVELYKDRLVEVILFGSYNNVKLPPEVRASKKSR